MTSGANSRRRARSDGRFTGVGTCRRRGSRTGDACVARKTVTERANQQCDRRDAFDLDFDSTGHAMVHRDRASWRGAGRQLDADALLAGLACDAGDRRHRRSRTGSMETRRDAGGASARAAGGRAPARRIRRRHASCPCGMIDARRLAFANHRADLHGIHFAEPPRDRRANAPTFGFASRGGRRSRLWRLCRPFESDPLALERRDLSAPACVRRRCCSARTVDADAGRSQLGTARLRPRPARSSSRPQKSARACSELLQPDSPCLCA